MVRWVDTSYIESIKPIKKREGERNTCMPIPVWDRRACLYTGVLINVRLYACVLTRLYAGVLIKLYAGVPMGLYADELIRPHACVLMKMYRSVLIRLYEGVLIRQYATLVTSRLLLKEHFRGRQLLFHMNLRAIRDALKYFPENYFLCETTLTYKNNSNTIAQSRINQMTKIKNCTIGYLFINTIIHTRT